MIKLTDCGVCGGEGIVMCTETFYADPCPECMHAGDLERAERAADMSMEGLDFELQETTFMEIPKVIVNGEWMIPDPNRDDLRDKCNVEPHSNS